MATKTRSYDAADATAQIALCDKFRCSFPQLRPRVTTTGVTVRIDDDATYRAVSAWADQMSLALRRQAGGRTLLIAR